jgi:methylmalonyl-CoA mutase
MGSHRSAEPFERLRDAADRFRVDTGRGPCIFLAVLGRPSDFAPRAAFAKVLLEAGGIRVLGSEGFASGEDAVRAYRSSGLESACLCSSDEIYASPASDAASIGKTLVAQVARELNDAGCSWLLVTGNPGEREASLRGLGVDDFLFAGIDVVGVLERTQKAIGVTP